MSHDESLRIWDVEMQKMVVRPLLGHEYEVTSVARRQVHSLEIALEYGT